MLLKGVKNLKLISSFFIRWNLLVSCFLFLSDFKLLAQQLELQLPMGHTDKINSIQFSPKGKYLLTASNDKTAKIWDFASGKVIHDLVGEQDRVKRAQFSSNGEYIVTFSEDTIVKVWNTVSGKLMHDLTGHKDEVYSASFSPNGKYIVTASQDKTAKIWETATGKVVGNLIGHSAGVVSAQFSPNGIYVITASSDNSARVWEVATGRIVHDLKHDERYVRIAQFSFDGKLSITVAGETVKLWNAVNGKAIFDLSHEDIVDMAQLSSDNKYIATISDRYVRIWDVHTGKLIHKLEAYVPDEWNPGGFVTAAQFSPDSKYVVTSSTNDIAIFWDLASGKAIQTFRHNGTISSVSFSLDGKYMATGGLDGTTVVWDVRKGSQQQIFKGDIEHQAWAQFSPEGQFLLIFDGYYTIKMWDMVAGKILYNLPKSTKEFKSTHFSSDGKYMITTDRNKFTLWETATGKLVHAIPSAVDTVVFGPDSQHIATLSRKEVKVWDTQRGNLMHQLTAKEKEFFKSVQFSPDNKYLLTSLDNNVTTIWSATSDSIIHELKGTAAQFSTQGRYVVTTNNREAFLWETASGKLIRTLDNKASILSVKFGGSSSNYIVTVSKEWANFWERSTGKYLGPRYFELGGENVADLRGVVLSPDMEYAILISVDYAAQIWNSTNDEKPINLTAVYDISINSKMAIVEKGSLFSVVGIEHGQEIVSFSLIDSTDWIVTHPSGLFDASASAMEKLYFVQGLDIIDFNQLKERYYEPGLWKKAITGEKLRSVVGMKSIELPPDIQVGKVDAKGYLPIELTNRGGGIGEVTILINGKEAIVDARPKGSDSNAKQLSLSVFIGNNNALIKGTENFIAVKAWNKEHWVVSRGAVTTYSLDGSETEYKPAIHIITSGVSDYIGTELDLKYAAKDAEDVSKALQLAARKLFGTEKSYIYNLTTSQSRDNYPTKANIIKAFENVSSVAHPLDVVVVYLSGHGINHGGQDGDWYYLTQDAYTSSSAAYNDPEIRRTSTLSSNELVELFKKMPALKQVLMIDACASGKVVENLMAKKDIESTTVRALDRMRDRTGLHIITGCTADAVSYEASKYGQGVLTYSLLEGIRGAALREDQFVDVNKLFQYAHDRVPTLAEGIGGIQTPQVFSPQGGQSFDIGLLTELEKKDIPIAKIRPVYIRSAFIDDDQLEDALQLGKKVDEALNDAASKGTGASLIFVDVREYPEGCKLSGRYTQEGGIIKLKLRKKCEGKDATLEISGKTMDEVRNKIISSL
jgi:WD40 repeat protein